MEKIYIDVKDFDITKLDLQDCTKILSHYDIYVPFTLHDKSQVGYWTNDDSNLCYKLEMRNDMLLGHYNKTIQIILNYTQLENNTKEKLTDDKKKTLLTHLHVLLYYAINGRNVPLFNNIVGNIVIGQNNKFKKKYNGVEYPKKGGTNLSQTEYFMLINSIISTPDDEISDSSESIIQSENDFEESDSLIELRNFIDLRQKFYQKIVKHDDNINNEMKILFETLIQNTTNYDELIKIINTKYVDEDISDIKEIEQFSDNDKDEYKKLFHEIKIDLYISELVKNKNDKQTIGNNFKSYIDKVRLKYKCEPTNNVLDIYRKYLKIIFTLDDRGISNLNTSNKLDNYMIKYINEQTPESIYETNVKNITQIDINDAEFLDKIIKNYKANWNILPYLKYYLSKEYKFTPQKIKDYFRDIKQIDLLEPESDVILINISSNILEVNKSDINESDIDELFNHKSLLDLTNRLMDYDRKICKFNLTELLVNNLTSDYVPYNLTYRNAFILDPADDNGEIIMSNISNIYDHVSCMYLFTMMELFDDIFDKNTGDKKKIKGDDGDYKLYEEYKKDIFLIKNRIKSNQKMKDFNQNMEYFNNNLFKIKRISKTGNINAQELFDFVENCLKSLNIIKSESSDLINTRKTALKKYMILNNFIKNNNFRSKILLLNNSIIEYFARVKYGRENSSTAAKDFNNKISEIDFTSFDIVIDDEKINLSKLDSSNLDNFYCESSNICNAGCYNEFNTLESKVKSAKIAPISSDNFNYQLISGGVLAGTIFYNYLGSIVLVILIILIIYLLYKLFIDKSSTTEETKKISGFRNVQLIDDIYHKVPNNDKFLKPDYIENITPSIELLDKISISNPYYSPEMNNNISKKPVLPVKPILPILPVRPIMPVNPSKPVLPSKPILPILPVRPIMPVNPSKPTIPVKPFIQNNPYIY